MWTLRWDVVNIIVNIIIVFTVARKGISTKGVIAQDVNLVSISSTLNKQIFRTNIISAAFSSYRNVVKSCRNIHSYEKCVHFTLMKLTPGRLMQLSQDEFSSRDFELLPACSCHLGHNAHRVVLMSDSEIRTYCSEFNGEHFLT